MLSIFFIKIVSIIIDFSNDCKGLNVMGCGVLLEEHLKPYQNLNILVIHVYEGIISIGDRAFRGFEKLLQIILPNTLKNISELIFYNTFSLKSVDFPFGITEIPSYTFYNCYSLISILIKSTIKKIYPNFAFSTPKLYEIIISPGSDYSTTPDHRIILYPNYETLFFACGSQITIPSHIKIIDSFFFDKASNPTIFFENSMHNLSIKPNAFNNLHGRSILFPEGLTTIHGPIFRQSSISLLYIPSTLIYVSYKIFEDMRSLSELEISKDCQVFKKIDGVLYSITQEIILFINNDIRDFEVPASVKEIPFSFLGNNLSTLSVNPNNNKFSSQDDAVYLKNFTSLITVAGCKKEIIIHENCTKIEVKAFYCSNIEKIVFPSNNLTSILDGVFENCCFLSSIDLPESLTYVGHKAFAFSGITNINFRGHYLELGYQIFFNSRIEKVNLSHMKMQSIPNKAFEYCNLKNIILPTIDFIGSYAFKGCENLRAVVFKGNVNRILENAFYGCKSLESIILPEGIEYIHREAFRGTNIAYIKIPNTLKKIEFRLFAESNIKEINISIESNLSEIESFAFEGTFLQSLFIPKCTSIIHAGAFFGVRTLCNLTADPENEFFSTINGILYSKTQKTLVACPEGIRDVCVPNTVTDILCYAFSGPTLESIVFIDGENPEINFVKSSFITATNLQHITLSKNNIIEQEMFSFITSLKTVKLDHSKIKKLPKSIFENCTSLEYVILPQQIEIIGSCSFKHCKSFVGVCQQRSFNWNFGLSRLNYLKSIENEAFYGCSEVDHILIPCSVESIGMYAFAYCSRLELLAYYGNNAFEGILFIGSGLRSVGVQSSYPFSFFGELPVDPYLSSSRFTAHLMTQSKVAILSSILILSRGKITKRLKYTL